MVDPTLVPRLAPAHGLDPALIRAVIAQESEGFVYAYRPEPRYRYFVDCRTGQPFRPLSPQVRASKHAPADFPYFKGGREQEWWAQQASWGLMQLMGAVARELGFRRPYLPEVCDPATNIELGCRFLASHLRWADGDLAKALGAYNAGRGNATGAKGRAYAATVLGRMRT